MMKKIIVLLAMSVIWQSGAFALTTLDKIEQSLYGFTTPNESETTRLERIEQKVYGKVSTGNNQNRIAKLKKDLLADYIGQEIEPREDTFMTDDDYFALEKEPAEAATMDYPVIDELEKQTFGKITKGQNIKTRLSCLEKKTFNKTYDKDDLSTRVDRLKAQLRPQSFASSGMQQQDNDFYTFTPDKMAQDYHLNQYGAPWGYNSAPQTVFDDPDDYYMPPAQSNTFSKPIKSLNLSTIEKTLYHKKFEHEPTSQRLSRIESSVFGTSFPNDSDNERIERISSAIQAQKSAKRYDSNTFSRNMATAFQIGTLILMVLACIL